jgi:radical SAM superfamily enzyme YgiQ (UPF0313 family)
MTRNSPLRIAFVHSPDAFLAETQQYGAMFMPVWAYTLAAYIEEPERYELKLWDMRFERVEEVSEADLFVFSGVNQDYESIVTTHARLRERYPDSTCIIGGPIAWSLNEAGEIAKLDMFNHICIGDGEETFPQFLTLLTDNQVIPKVLQTKQRFDVSKARGFYRPFLDATYQRYYGGVIEVSRGCPFLCEFCDIRILPDNNRPHNFDPAHIVSELDYMARLGIRQVLFAADDFIGDTRWAEEVADKIIGWQERTGRRVVLFTWLTINLSRHPGLLRKLRLANFDMLFIGVESFSKHSLMETAKVQNVTGDMIAALQEIQSYGFVVSAGLIFGFDSDTPECFNETLEGMAKAGLISGDPSLLVALPGTPLYRRMQLSGRLRNNKNSLGGYKYCTNIRYLMPRSELVAGFRFFVKRFAQGAYQYERLKAFLDNLGRGHYVPLQSEGYGRLGKFVTMVFKNASARKLLLQRLSRIAASPDVAWTTLRALVLTLSRSRRHPQISGVFQFWLFSWTNVLLKYESLSDADFDIESVPPEFDRSLILPDQYAELAHEDIPHAKTAAQQRATMIQLRRLMAPR